MRAVLALIFCPGLFHLNLGGGSFGLGRLVISANFQSECRFGQSLKVIMYALLYVYGWTDWQVLSFVKKKTGQNDKGCFQE